MIHPVCVIGGGASGLTAAVAAARALGEPGVVVLERLPRAGKKLLSTGSGRCNLSHREAGDPARYHSAESPATGGAETVARVLGRFGVRETLDFFEDIGIPVREDGRGRLYPYSLQAGAVVDALRFEAARLGAEIRPDTPVRRLAREGGVYRAGEVLARRVIVAAGGMASPSLGSDGSGYALLEGFGHTRTAVFAGLTQLTAGREAIPGLDGIRVEAGATLRIRGRAAASARDELLFTAYGLSGPLALSLSRSVSALGGEMSDVVLEADLLPDMDAAALAARLAERAEKRPEWPLENLFLGLLHKRAGLAVLRAAGLSPAALCGGLDGGGARRLASAVKAYRIPLTGTRGFGEAQVTCGGVRPGEFDPGTLESRLSPGLYACGEILDVDGSCGGFNLQWAWSSGWVAGTSAGRGA
ncbi:MAG: aminoacetone oxidase family FAD-binding enzyme [Oscillospiraceae bacterium]|nr:aminoacetone oxidase family FAD-binding enzyme [Oscillospiraceae bacterium]